MSVKGGVSMPQEWEQGNAARELSYEESSNPYKPLNYAERLKNAGKKPSSAAASASYAPGQLYGRSYAEPKEVVQQPLTPSAPPAAAPQMELPSYLQSPPPRYRSERIKRSEAVQPPLPVNEARPGTLYSADLFSHQPTAVMPSGYDDTPFASRMAEDFHPFFEEPAAPEWQPASVPEETPEDFFFEEELQPRPWRDPFTPAAPKEEKAEPRKQVQKAAKKPQAKPQRPPVRIGRVMALIAAAAMLLFCGIVGGKIILELSRNESDLEAARSEYRERTGQELHNGAARVDLLPAGQTFVPTATPTPTLFLPTPSPTPVIPIKEAAVFSLGRPDDGQMQEAVAAEPTPNPRTKLTSYPKNPLTNVHPSLTELIKENGDVVGRLVIDGVIDELVMHRNNTYYLTHNSLGVSSQAGAVFMDESCSLRFPPENLLLRGQCIVPGRTFNPLLQFATGGKAFVSTAATARLTTLYEEESYVLFAVIVASSDPASASYFNYASHPTFATDTAMMAYVESARQHSLYQFNVDVQPSDRLLTLSTMGGTDTLVLLYRMAREG